MKNYKTHLIHLLHFVILVIIQQLTGMLLIPSFTSYIVVFEVILLFYVYFFIKRQNLYAFIITYAVLMLLIDLFVEFTIVFYFVVFLALCTLFLSKFLTQKLLSSRNLFITLIVIAISYTTIAHIYPNVREYLRYKDGYKTMPETIGLPMYDESGTPVTIDNEKIYVLDLWSTSCGICIRQFPDFYEVSQKHKQNPNIEFVYVLVQNPEESPERYKKYWKRERYPLDIWFVESFEKAQKYDIYAYPTLIIINKGKVTYKGHATYDKNSLYNNIEELIDEQVNKNKQNQ